MYRKLAIASGTITVLILVAYGLLALLDEESQFVKEYGYVIGLLTLPFCCGLLPLTSVFTVIFTILAVNESNGPDD